jgi:ABC-type branched-subunit amino acid transport system substrate-binding protein
MPRSSKSGGSNRRQLLKGLGAAGLTGVAGCLGAGGDGDEDTPTASGDDVGATSTTANQGDSGESGALEIGVGVPLTGDLGFFGNNIVPAVQYVSDQINEAGGIDGRNVEVLTADTRTSSDQALSITQQFVGVENVHAIIGFTAATLFGVIDQIQENQVPYFPATSSGDLVPRGGEYVYMVFPSDLLAARALGLTAAREEYNGEQSYNQMGLLVSEGGLYSSFTEPLREAFTEQGGEITEVVQFQAGKSSYQSEAQRVVSSDPEIITVLAGPSDTVKLMRACSNAGYQGQYLGAEDTSTDEFLSNAPSNLTEGMLAAISTSPGYVDGSFKTELGEAFQEYSEREYGIGAWLAYDAMTLTGLAMKKAELDGDEVTRQTIAGNIASIGRPPGETVQNYPDGLSALENGDEVDFQGVRSNCNFDDRGNVSTPYNTIQVRDGEWQTVEQIPVDVIADI